MPGPGVGVGVIIVDSDQLLMIRRGHGPAAGDWSIPGGHVERGETLAEAVVRELREETGLEGVCADFVGWDEKIGEEFHFVLLAFRATLLEVTDPVAGDDAAEARWVPLSEVADYALVDGLAEFLSDNGIIPVIA